MRESSDLAAIERELETAAFDPSKWTIALDRLTELCGSTLCIASTIGPENFRCVVSSDGAAAVCAWEHEGWSQQDPFAPRVRASPPLTLVQNHKVLSAQHFATPYYSDFSARHEVTFAAAWRLAIDDTDYAIASYRSHQSGPLSDAELSILQRALPATTSSLVLSSRIASLGKTSIPDALLDSSFPMLLLSGDCRVLQASNGAELMLRNEMIIKNGYILTSDPIVSSGLGKLQRSLREDAPHSLQPFYLCRRPGSRVIALPMALRAAGCDLFSGVRAVLILRAIDQPKKVCETTIRELFGLTTAEANVTALLVLGNSVADIARRRKCSVETVRALLKSAFARTETHSQADLIALVIRATVTF